ncbi:MAG: 7-cyano-7-deazaguanine synthase QueC [Dethiobacter sp.]|jgi:7-cyano-7-deazaguanine synthase|nr:7-cyano-7-deazaguanine synthase QueC [Dethiobacter sp.]MBS3989775.1 7-cyano-7-deazaguanine synthase QueC [Dethiobacter sp.]
MNKAVVLLSGGIDSVTALALASRENEEIYALSFNYGQRHSKELACARWQAKYFAVKEHVLIELDMLSISCSSLLDRAIAIPKEETDSIPNTVVPGRNMIFLSFAAAYAETKRAEKIYLGVSQVDYSGYVDCREPFVTAMEKAINEGITWCAEGQGSIKVIAPFMHMSKVDEIKLGNELGVDYSKTWTCYEESEQACGECPSCRLRIKAFNEIGIVDPIVYKKV